MEAAPMFYFLCSRCDCKWFAAQGGALCPRCGHECSTTEHYEVPWLTRKYNHASADGALYADPGTGP